jgi:hypothetical protein
MPRSRRALIGAALGATLLFLLGGSLLLVLFTARSVDQAPLDAPPTADSAELPSAAPEPLDPDASPPVTTAPPPPNVTDRFAEVDAALGELVGGNVAFNTPERMQLRESRTITLITSPQLDPEALGEKLRERIGGGDPITVEALQIAPLMEAQLEGAMAFEVKPLSPARQPVSRSAPTEWRWSITAQEGGTQALHLTISAIITVDGERFPRSLNVLDRVIEVDVSAAQRLAMFVDGNWQWVMGTIIIPVVVWVWTNRKGAKRKRRST